MTFAQKLLILYFHLMISIFLARDIYIMCAKKKTVNFKKRKPKYCEVLKVIVPLHPQMRNEPPH